MNDKVWNFAVRKPLWWFLRRFLSFEEAKPLVDHIEELVWAVIESKQGGKS